MSSRPIRVLVAGVLLAAAVPVAAPASASSSDPVADLAISTYAPEQRRLGDRLVYRHRVVNLGPDAAHNVTVAHRISEHATIVVMPSICERRAAARDTLIWCRASRPIAAGEVFQFRILTRAAQTGTVDSFAAVWADEADSSYLNNENRDTTQVLP